MFEEVMFNPKGTIAFRSLVLKIGLYLYDIFIFSDHVYFFVVNNNDII